MEVAEIKQVARAAVAVVAELFAEQDISAVCLEEAQFDTEAEEWAITIGFDRPRPARPVHAALGGPLIDRVFKVVRLSRDGDVRAVADRAA